MTRNDYAKASLISKGYKIVERKGATMTLHDIYHTDYKKGGFPIVRGIISLTSFDVVDSIGYARADKHKAK